MKPPPTKLDGRLLVFCTGIAKLRPRTGGVRAELGGALRPSTCEGAPRDARSAVARRSRRVLHSLVNRVTGSCVAVDGTSVVSPDVVSPSDGLTQSNVPRYEKNSKVPLRRCGFWASADMMSRRDGCENNDERTWVLVVNTNSI